MHAVTRRFVPPGIPASQIACCIGLLSDTHMPERCDALPPALFTVLQGVDLLLHAGDVGELWVLDRLSAIAPTIAVHGNDDTAEAKRELPYQQLVMLGGRRLLLCHGHHPDPDTEQASRRDDAWQPKLAWRAALGQGSGARIVVFGHTHIPMVQEYAGVLLVNPGALASPNGVTCQRLQSVALLFLTHDGVPHVSHVDLARPTARYKIDHSSRAWYRKGSECSQHKDTHDRFAEPHELDACASR